MVRGAWRNFVPRPDDDRFFAERMTARLCTPCFHPHPLSTHFKSAHRAVRDVRIGRGTTRRSADGLVALRGWYPIEILHFPVRSFEHCRRKYVTQFVALERNAEKGIPGHMAEAYERVPRGTLDGFYAPLVVDDEALDAGSRTAPTQSTPACATRCALSASAPWHRPHAQEPAPPRPAVEDAALFAAEYTSLGEADLGASFGDRIDDAGSEARPPRAEPRGAGPPPRRKPTIVTGYGGRLMAFVPTRRAALALFVVALGVFWFQALGWPMAKGRDTWDYLVYYLQLFDSKPPLSQVQLFRAPLTPFVVGLPMDIGGSILLEVVFGAALRRIGGCVERDRADVRTGSRPRFGGGAARVSGLGDALPPGVERRRVRDRACRVGARRREDIAPSRRRGASSSWAPASRRSS